MQDAKPPKTEAALCFPGCFYHNKEVIFKGDKFSQIGSEIHFKQNFPEIIVLIY